MGEMDPEASLRRITDALRGRTAGEVWLHDALINLMRQAREGGMEATYQHLHSDAEGHTWTIKYPSPTPR